MTRMHSIPHRKRLMHTAALALTTMCSAVFAAEPALDVSTDASLARTTSNADAITPASHEYDQGKIVIADRASGTISVISAASDEVIATIDLPEADAPSQPMYVFAAPRLNRFFVGDRGNNRVIAYNASTLAVDGVIPAGNGVFHMWGDLRTRQLWVNNDIDNTITIINMATLNVIDTIAIPHDLAALGGKPHDVILSPHGLFAYVTIVGLDGENDYVVQYLNFWRFRFEIARAAVGKDAHLSLTPRRPWLFVPCQNTDDVYVLSRYTLRQIAVLDVPGAHGSGMPKHGRYFYTTNLPAGGEDALYVIDTRTLEVVGEPVMTPYAIPHNIALTPDGRKLYVTHSGPHDKVTVYSTSRHNPTPQYLGEITVGDNPFGLAYVP